MPATHFMLQSTPLPSEPPFALSAAVGALVTFDGLVRDHNEGKAVVRLDYSAYALLAVREGARIVDAAVTRFGLVAAAAVHRVGELSPGEAAVRVWAGAEHRSEAFAGCAYIIDEIKARVPIWKKETYRDGASAWVGCAHTHDDAAP